jgi:hypothetical protein
MWRDIKATRCNLEATCWEFEMQLVEVEAWTKHEGGGNAGTSTDKVKQWSWLDPCPEQDSSSRLQLITTIEHPTRRPHICIVGTADDIVECPSRSDIRRHHWGYGGPLRRPPADCSLPVSTQSQNPSEQQVTPIVCSSCRAGDPPGPCWVTCELHPQGCWPCIHQWHERLRTETEPPHGQRQLDQWGSQIDP